MSINCSFSWLSTDKVSAITFIVFSPRVFSRSGGEWAEPQRRLPGSLIQQHRWLGQAQRLSSLVSATRRPHVLFQQGELLEEIVFFDAQRTLEETRQVPQHAHFTAALRQQGQPGQV